MEARDYIAALLELGLTQSQIAKATGIPQPTVSKIFRGEVRDVLSRNYRKLAALHDVRCGSGEGATSRAEASGRESGGGPASHESWPFVEEQRIAQRRAVGRAGGRRAEDRPGAGTQRER